MKNVIIWSVIAGAASAAIIALMYKRDEADELLHSARGLGDRLVKYGNKIKDRFLHHVKGPNGEDVYIDMYDRQFYENEEGRRIYLAD